jgi:hypothetical protein
MAVSPHPKEILMTIYTCPHCGQRFSLHELALYEGECPNLECPGPQAKEAPVTN